MTAHKSTKNLNIITFVFTLLVAEEQYPVYGMIFVLRKFMGLNIYKHIVFFMKILQKSQTRILIKKYGTHLLQLFMW